MKGKSENKDLLNPQVCVLEVLEKCMLRCKMCGNWKCKGTPDELSIDEWKNFIVRLREQLGTQIEINITGGEPLLKEGVLDLIRFTARQGFKVIMVSNAYLIDETLAREIAGSGLNCLGISLDSLDEKTHDYIRGVEGVYKKVFRAIDYLDKFRVDGFSLSLQTIIMKHNLAEIIELAEWGERDRRIGNMYFQAIVQPNFSSSDDGWFTDNKWYLRDEFKGLWPDNTEEVNAVIDGLIELKKRGFKIANPLGQLEAFKLYFQDPQGFNRKVKCRKGKHIFSVSPLGDINLCHIYGRVGNLRAEGVNLRDLWYSREANEIRRKMESCQKYCGPLVNCYFEDGQ